MWTGWLRLSDGWEKVCEGSTIRSCHRKLIVIAERRGIRKSSKRFLQHGGGAPVEPDEYLSSIPETSR